MNSELELENISGYFPASSKTLSQMHLDHIPTAFSPDLHLCCICCAIIYLFLPPPLLLVDPGASLGSDDVDYFTEEPYFHVCRATRQAKPPLIIPISPSSFLSKFLH